MKIQVCNLCFSIRSISFWRQGWQKHPVPARWRNQGKFSRRMQETYVPSPSEGALRLSLHASRDARPAPPITIGLETTGICTRLTGKPVGNALCGVPRCRCNGTPRRGFSAVHPVPSRNGVNQSGVRPAGAAPYLAASSEGLQPTGPQGDRPTRPMPAAPSGGRIWRHPLEEGPWGLEGWQETAMLGDNLLAGGDFSRKKRGFRATILPFDARPVIGITALIAEGGLM